MAVEIERKFLVSSDTWRSTAAPGVLIRQAYLAGNGKCSVRARLEGDRASLNIKSWTLGVVRLEYDYAIPGNDAEEMIDQLCAGPVIEKTRYRLDYAGRVWEVDVFHGDNDGLIVAEIELERPDAALELPPWIGEEVSDDPRYYNVCLVEHPYCEWPDSQSAPLPKSP